MNKGIEMKTEIVHSYIDNLIDNTDGKFDKLGSCWFIVPRDWLENIIIRDGWNDLEDFYENYTYDHSDVYLNLAIEDGVLLGCGCGIWKEYHELEHLLKNREEQLEKEVYRSYNYGYVAGEISGVKKAISLLK